MDTPLPIDIFNELTDAFADIYAAQRDIKSATEASLKTAMNQKNLIDKDQRGGEFDRVVLMQNMHFNRFDNNQTVSFSHRKTTIDERIESIVISKNRQYQWLLVEAYEAFEDFIQDSYAIIGFYDKESWPLVDYGNITLSELPNKNIEWFKEKAEKKKGVPNSVIELFRLKFPAIKAIESKNNYGVNPHLMIKLIEMMRHVIVHNKGKVSCIDGFTKRVLESCGRYKSGNPEQEHVDVIKSYLIHDGKSINKIRLLEIKEGGLSMPINIFEHTCNYLLGYAQMITDQISEHIKEKIEMPST